MASRIIRKYKHRVSRDGTRMIFKAPVAKSSEALRHPFDSTFHMEDRSFLSLTMRSESTKYLHFIIRISSSQLST